MVLQINRRRPVSETHQGGAKPPLAQKWDESLNTAAWYGFPWHLNGKTTQYPTEEHPLGAGHVHFAIGVTVLPDPVPSVFVPQSSPTWPRKLSIPWSEMSQVIWICRGFYSWGAFYQRCFNVQWLSFLHNLMSLTGVIFSPFSITKASDYVSRKPSSSSTGVACNRLHFSH